MPIDSCVLLGSTSAAWPSLPLDANGRTNNTDCTALGGERLPQPASTEGAARQENTTDSGISSRDDGRGDKPEDPRGLMALRSRGCPAAALATVGREYENEPACAAAALMSASLLSMEAATSALGRFAFRANSLLSPLRPAARADTGEGFCKCDLFIIERAAAVDVTCETWISAPCSAA